MDHVKVAELARKGSSLSNLIADLERVGSDLTPWTPASGKAAPGLQSSALERVDSALSILMGEVTFTQLQRAASNLSEFQSPRSPMSRSRVGSKVLAVDSDVYLSEAFVRQEEEASNLIADLQRVGSDLSGLSNGSEQKCMLSNSASRGVRFPRGTQSIRPQMEAAVASSTTSATLDTTENAFERATKRFEAAASVVQTQGMPALSRARSKSLIIAAELEPASSGMFSLSRARSNVNELYDNEKPSLASQLVAAAVAAAEQVPASNGMFSLSRARSNVNELYYKEEPPPASQPVAAAVAAAEQVPASSGMSSLSRARSNVGDLHYKELSPASEPAFAPVATAERPLASSGMFSLSRARSNVNELYDKEEPPPASQPVAASISAAELEPASNGMFS